MLLCRYVTSVNQVLVAAQKIAHWPSCLGELHLKAGYVLTLLAGVAQLVGEPSLCVNTGP